MDLKECRRKYQGKYFKFMDSGCYYKFVRITETGCDNIFAVNAIMLSRNTGRVNRNELIEINPESADFDNCYKRISKNEFLNLYNKLAKKSMIDCPDSLRKYLENIVDIECSNIEIDDFIDLRDTIYDQTQNIINTINYTITASHGSR